MRSLTITVGLAIALLAAAVTMKAPSAEPEAPSMKAAPAAVIAAQPARQADEQAIRAVAATVANTYNAHDAAALASLFTKEAEIVNEDGTAFQGRAVIEQTFARIFQEHPESRMEISVQSIRFVSPAVAMEDGTTTVTHRAGEPAEHSRYTGVHVKQDGKWLMASARDLPDEDSEAEDELERLDWLVGEWVDESPDALIRTSYRWTDNHRFLLSEFTIEIGGRTAMNGSQRIGWDPSAKAIRSWVFDSEGGFAKGVWARNGSQWIVKMTGLTRDGKTASSTNVITRVSKDRATWQSRDRIVGGEVTPDVEAIPIVRKPPMPK
ncbi:MAG: SgcJ/EcaC family oxidoreductase [Planctomycetota bacterium]